MKFTLQRCILLLGLLIAAFSVSARGVYQTDADFLAETFNQAVPKSKVVWLKGDVKQEIAKILGHDYPGLRIRYWPDNAKTVWILEEIGKEKPITFGIVVADNKIQQMKVLAFRESRGDEIRYPAFTRQFDGAQLIDQQLDRHIDGISGATLSVWAMTSIARLALYLDNATQN